MDEKTKKFTIEDTKEHQREREYLNALMCMQFIPILDTIKKSEMVESEKKGSIIYKFDELLRNINTTATNLKIPEGLSIHPEYSNLALFIRGELMQMQKAEEIPEELDSLDLTDLFILGIKATDGPAKTVFETAIQRARKRAKLFYRESWAGRRAKAIEIGAFTELEARAVIPTKEEYHDVFTRNKLFYITDKMRNSFDAESGKLNPITAGALTTEDFDKITSTDPGLLAHVLHYVISYYVTEGQNGNTVPIYLPKFFRDNNIDPRKKLKDKETDLIKTENTPLTDARYNKFIEMIAPYEQVIGRFDNGDIYRFMTFESYNKDSETVIISTPYLFEIARRVEAGKFNRLIHPSITSEPNKAAQEIAIRIVQGLATRGARIPDQQPHAKISEDQATERTTYKTDKEGNKVKIVEKFEPDEPRTKEAKKWTYRTKFSTLIKECPLIQKELEEIAQKTVEKDGKTIPHPNRNQLYNTKLKQTFTAAFRIVEERTDAKLYFENLTLHNRDPKTGDYKPPTKSQLNSLLIYTFTGKNPDYILSYYNTQK